MYEHPVEAFIAVDDPDVVSKHVVACIRNIGCSVEVHGRETHLDFGEAKAIIKTVTDGILLWADADDAFILTGLKVMLETCICTGRSTEIGKWALAAEAPSQSVNARGAKSGRA